MISLFEFQKCASLFLLFMLSSGAYSPSRYVFSFSVVVDIMSLIVWRKVCGYAYVFDYLGTAFIILFTLYPMNKMES